MAIISSRGNVAKDVLARVSLTEKILLAIAAVVVAVSIPMACVEIARGHVVTALVLAGAPLLPLFRSTKILANAHRRGRFPG